MADKLDWLNKHIVLFNHAYVAEVVQKEKYRIPFALKELAESYPATDSFAVSLFKEKKYKECCQFISYTLHKRALGWWAYCCVLSLREELKQTPAKPRDIADIGKPKELEVPEWAKMPDLSHFPDGTKRPQSIEDLESIPAYSDMVKKAKELIAKGEELLKKVPKEQLDRYNKVHAELISAFKSQTGGKSPQDLCDEAVATLKKMIKEHPFDESLTDPMAAFKDSPMVKASEELKLKLEKMRLGIIEKIKAAVPEKSDDEKLEQTSAAIDAAYALISTPNDVTAKMCLDSGNECPDLPEGLLALVCFWCYGNLAPDPDNVKAPVVRTPSGLAANGFNSLLTMCALANGGTRSYMERIDLYCRIGFEIAHGFNNWAESLEQSIAPHNDTGEDRFKGYLGYEGNSSEDAQTPAEQTDEKSHDHPAFVRFKG